MRYNEPAMDSLRSSFRGSRAWFEPHRQPVPGALPGLAVSSRLPVPTSRGAKGFPLNCPLTTTQQMSRSRLQPGIAEPLPTAAPTGDGSSEKPLLLVDIDGVISLFGFDGSERPEGSFHAIDGIPHFL